MSANERARLEAELAAVERQWDADQALHMVKGPNGELVPRPPTNVARCILLMVGSVIGMAFLAATPLPPWVMFIGLVPFAVGTFRLMIGSSKSEAFERCRTEYETRRTALLRKLHELSPEY